MAEQNLDQLLCGSELSLLKNLLPFFPPKLQTTLAVYIKITELTRLLSLLRAPQRMHTLHSSASGTFPFPQKQPEPEQILSVLAQSQTEEEKQQMESLLQMISMFKMMQEFSGDGGMDLSSLLSPEQQAIFDSFQTSMNQENDKQEKEEDNGVE